MFQYAAVNNTITKCYCKEERIWECTFPYPLNTLDFVCCFLMKLNSVVFYVWLLWMDPNGKNCVFSVGFFHPTSLSSVKWENYRRVQLEVNETIDKLLFSGTGAVSCFGLTRLYWPYFHFTACPTFGLHQVCAAWHCSKTMGYFNHIKCMLSKGNNFCFVHG